MPLTRLARIFGVLYLIVALGGGFAEVVRSSLVKNGDPAATAQNILDSEFLFRVGFSTDLVAFSAEVALALVIYVFFKQVNEGIALLAGFFRLAQAVVLGLNMLNQFVALLILTSTEQLASFTDAQREALALLYMDAHNYGYLIGLIFFGLSSFALGYLVLRTDYFPRVFGVLLMSFVAFGYILDSFTSFLIADKPEVISIVLIAPAALSEVAFILWLVIKGAKLPPAADASRSAALPAS